jgi:D-beta-D-heptose 7-phosphate kinase/D-beta-D-heptose 1-phosphate adenosyltransferase
MNSLLALVEKFSRAHLLVVGDLMLDRFIRGEVERISPEAPVPVLQVVSENSSLGGAANVIHNVQSLGGRVTACGIVGSDNAGKRIIAALRQAGAATAGVFVDGGYQTIQNPSSPVRAINNVRLDRESARRRAGRAQKLANMSPLDRSFDGISCRTMARGDHQSARCRCGPDQPEKLSASSTRKRKT